MGTEAYIDFSQTGVPPKLLYVGNWGKGSERVHYMDSSSTDTNYSPANTIRKGVLVCREFLTADQNKIRPYRIPADLANGVPIAGVTADDAKVVDKAGNAWHAPTPIITHAIIEAKNIWYETSTAGTMAQLSNLTGRDLFILLNALAANHPYVIGSPRSGASPVIPDHLNSSLATGLAQQPFSPNWVCSPLLEAGVQIFVRI